VRLDPALPATGIGFISEDSAAAVSQPGAACPHLRNISARFLVIDTDSA